MLSVKLWWSLCRLLHPILNGHETAPMSLCKRITLPRYFQSRVQVTTKTADLTDSSYIPCLWTTYDVRAVKWIHDMVDDSPLDTMLSHFCLIAHSLSKWMVMRYDTSTPIVKLAVADNLGKWLCEAVNLVIDLFVTSSVPKGSTAMDVDNSAPDRTDVSKQSLSLVSLLERPT